jgi:YD repeat-containing protein
MRLLKKFWLTLGAFLLVLLGVARVEDGKKPEKGGEGDSAEGDADGDAGQGTSESGTGSESQNPTTGDPVDVITGTMVVNTTDFELPGPIPLIWRRNWYSDSRFIGHLGYGTSCNYEMNLEVSEKRQISIFLASGRSVTFPYLLPEDEFFSYKERLLLRREVDHYCLFDPKTRYSHLFYSSEKGSARYKLSAICDAQGHKIIVKYDSKGFLSKIIDSVGRELNITTNGSGLISQVALGDHIFVQYRYNDEQDITEVIDAAGQATHITYQNHLIVQRSDRNKNSFYWKYDKKQTGARVLETWGDGNVLYKIGRAHV